jgi:hypothetical protein
MVFSLSGKFIGNITTNLLVPAPELVRLPLVNHETLNTSSDIYELATAATTDTFWLPPAWQRTKPIYILNGSANGNFATIVCCAGAPCPESPATTPTPPPAPRSPASCPTQPTPGSSTPDRPTV